MGRYNVAKDVNLGNLNFDILSQDFMPKTLLLATRNLGKQKEIQKILEYLDWQVLTLRDFPGCPEVEETGSTFLENAELKATAYSNHTGVLTLAEDSGLEVDALGKKPGIYSARYARGEGSTDEENIDRVLEEMCGVPTERRSARFVCAAVIAQNQDLLFSTLQTVEGLVAEEKHGNQGFGYDPIFYYPPLLKHFAELTAETKNAVSHRGKALEEIYQFLRQYLP